MKGGFHRPDRQEMKGQPLRRITASDRKMIALAVSSNRRSRKWQEAKENAQFGPHTCERCHAEPCGSLWPHGACCPRCTHLPMPHWRLTHVLWYRKKPFYVMEVAARRPGAPTEEEQREMDLDRSRGKLSEEQRWGIERSDRLPGSGVQGGFRVPGSGVRSDSDSSCRQPVPGTRSPVITDAVYYRWDGVSQWIRRARTHYFLGVRVSPAEFMRSLPNDEELAEFAPRERAPNPFEEGVTERPADEVGEPMGDRTEEPPPTEESRQRFYKQGLAFVELAEAEEVTAREDAELVQEGSKPDE